MAFYHQSTLRREWPEVMDVFVKTEGADMTPVCPLLVSEQRNPDELQTQLREAVAAEVKGAGGVDVSKITAHFNSASEVSVDCYLQVRE